MQGLPLTVSVGKRATEVSQVDLIRGTRRRWGVMPRRCQVVQWDLMEVNLLLLERQPQLRTKGLPYREPRQVSLQVGTPNKMVR